MLHPSIKKKKSRIAGYGLYATAFIPKGAVVWQIDPNAKLYSYGELLEMGVDINFSVYRYKDKYIIAHGDDHYMNHSCEPNAWHKGDDMLVAMKDIYPGDEITYDYVSSEVGCSDGSWECFCGTKKCRKTISDLDCLDKDFQKRFKGHLPSWVEEYIRDEEEKRSYRKYAPTLPLSRFVYKLASFIS